MSRRTLAAALAALALLLGAGAVVGLTTGGAGGGRPSPSAASSSPGGTASTQPPGATATRSAPAAGTGYYVALGDSLAAGFQNGADHRAAGYVGAVRTAVEKRDGPTELVNLACSGETTTSMLEGGGCRYDAGSQLAEAEKFLRSHAADVHLVTVDIGGNDVARCGFGGLKPSCTKPALATLSENLPQITRRLRAAAPRAEVVVLNYYDPFLVLDLLGDAGLGQQSVKELAKVNAAISSSAKRVDARVADVATAFQTTVTTPTTVKDLGRLPTNLARILQWTWMAPPRFDFHANDLGYAVMAGAVTKQLR
ncbi:MULTISPECIES: SGNH/GDSL hydrolase family protein [unclassified Phycicoccus]|uniref:SGNH/GDSL hydrolase family protein n=1 Tax=unclassified Phycicoccus TaxID=2637926 RepID=UPI000B25F037|nr:MULTISPECIES: SGNH/GDSL hydrolase family protein [unclassified Phycicoccus]